MNQPAISPELTGARKRQSDIFAALEFGTHPVSASESKATFAVGNQVFVRLLLGGLVPAIAPAKIISVEPGDSFAEVRFYETLDETTPTGRRDWVPFEDMYHAA